MSTANTHDDTPASTAQTGAPDAVDAVVAAWQRERPDLDLTAIAVVGRLGRVNLLLGPAQEQVFTEFGLQRGEFDVLAALRRSGAPYTLSPSRLSDLLMLSRGGMTNRLDRLESAGMIERSLDRADRRSFQIRLTEHGYATVDGAMTQHTANVTALLGGLTPREVTTLNELARKLLHHLTAPPQ
ncbi:MarR family winged helix-turn-helix transcriptional regulator [Actinomadura violacea]|uniref:MarR family transcriptional regulator n=1 Tax=Actinomadura violacea TaxID=2819934 RepID=A0ABS3S4C1_9ACTN|nr:MarR family transcriptional regulator [Actinomadura violacea]MBO2463593.1 MarR family transcriptional regulator [Actinomadura violacea]